MEKFVNFNHLLAFSKKKSLPNAALKIRPNERTKPPLKSDIFLKCSHCPFQVFTVKSIEIELQKKTKIKIQNLIPGRLNKYPKE